MEQSIQEIQRLSAEIKKASAIESAKLAKQLAAAVKEHQAAFREPIERASSLHEETATNIMEEFRRQAESLSEQRTREMEAVLEKQRESVEKIVSGMVQPVKIQVSEAHKRLLGLGEEEGEVLMKIRGRLIGPEEEEAGG